MYHERFGLRRRDFIKGCAAATAGTMAPMGGLFGAAKALAADDATAPLRPGSNAIRSVRPEIGTGWRGHMFPGAVAPFGLVQLSPDTAGPPETRWNERGDYTGWDHCPGYYYPDNIVIGFSHTHVQGTGGADLGRGREELVMGPGNPAGNGPDAD
jgi:putative alpha-1,2-mannosidase